MSLKTWKKEFYPKSAKSTKKAEAVEHSLRKWRGILPANLKKHGLNRDINRIDDESDYDTVFRLDDETCSLCVWFYKDDAPVNGDDQTTCCDTCPLFKATGKPCPVDNSVYSDAVYDDKVVRMVKALEKARKFI